MGNPGSVTFMFSRQGVIIIEKEDVDEDQLMEDALESGASDFLTDDEDIFEIRTEANDLGVIRDELEEYRLSVYLYSFSLFLEVMLLENFDPDYLASTSGKIEERSLAYRMLYTKAYDALESQADSSVRAMALGGLSGAMGFLGKAIEKTPVGDLTPIDEALQDASKGIGEFNKGVKRDMMRKITDARSSDVRPFVDNIENVNRLYNEPTMLLSDDNAIYVLPMGDESSINAGA